MTNMRNLPTRQAIALAVVALLASPVTPVLAATVFRLTPIDLGSGYTLTGSIMTDNSRGPITGANIKNWNLKVTAISDIVYSPMNTTYVGSGVALAGDKVLVPTSPNGILDGGSLAFRGATYRYQVRVADFTGANTRGGQALYIEGGNFDFLGLGRPRNTNYVAATAATPGGLVYDLVPKRFSPTTIMTGTLTANSNTGPAVFTDWNIRIRDTQTWTFNPRNSSVFNDLGLNASGSALTVTPLDADGNPGSLSFGRFAGDFTGVFLGDFSYDAGGITGIQTPFLLQTIGSLPLDASGNYVVGTTRALGTLAAVGAIPEPATWAMMIIGFGSIGAACRRRRTRSAPDMAAA